MQRILPCVVCGDKSKVVHTLTIDGQMFYCLTCGRRLEACWTLYAALMSWNMQNKTVAVEAAEKPD